jgi:hypothetical protein
LKIHLNLRIFFSFNVKRNKNHHPIKNSVFVAAGSAAYPQKGIPLKSGTSWLFRGFGTQPHGNLKPFLVSAEPRPPSSKSKYNNDIAYRNTR